MGRISLILAIIFLAACHAQVLPDTPTTSSDDPNALVSPWSQWMALKAPPIPGLPMGGGGKKKKKLIPGPPPPEGTPEAPWVTWTRTKITTAMSSPSAGLLASPPSPAVVNDSDSSEDGAEPSVWIQWTQMKLPLTSVSAPSSSAPPQETPWDAWTKLKLSQLVSSPPSPPQAPAGLVRRMAPDRYIVSTMAPRLTNWALASQQPQAIQPQETVPPQVNYSSLRPTYLHILHPSLYNTTTPQASTRSSSSSSSSSSQSQVTPQQTLSQVLQPIPHQLVAQIIAKATPEELTDVILAVSQAEEQQSSAGTTVGELLPASLLAKIPDDLTPLLTTPITPTSSSGNIVPEPLSLLPSSAKLAVVSQATPEELQDVLDTLTKLEALPAKDQAPIASLSVATILPSSLQPKISPTVSTQKLVPPALLSLPSTLINSILPLATPTEVETLVANAAKLEKMPSVVPRPSVGALLPPSLAAKVPPSLAPFLSQPVPPPQVSTFVKPTPPDAMDSLPAPLAHEIVAKATIREVKTIVSALTVLEAAAPLAGVEPLAISAIPVAVIAKLPPQQQLLLAEPITLPPSPQTPEEQPVVALLQAIPPPVLQEILTVATPEELAAIEESVISAGAVTTPILPLLPISLVTKLPPQVAPILSQEVTLPPPPPKSETIAIPGVPSDVTTALSALPQTLIIEILETATPVEIHTLAETVMKLENLPAEEKPLIDALDVASILPSTLLPKLPPSVLPLLGTPIVIPAVTPVPLPVIRGVPPAVVAVIAPALSALPSSLVTEILTLAKPAELDTVKETITKLEHLPPSEAPLADKLEVASILPAALVARIPAQEVPLLAAPITITPVSTAPVPVIPGVPHETVETVVATMSAVSPPVVTLVLTLATPEELTKIADTIHQLEPLPGDEHAPVKAKLEVGAILPATLLRKLPAPITTLLRVPVTLPPVGDTPLAHPVPIIPGVAPQTVETVANALSAVPSPVVIKLLTIGTPLEIATVAEKVKKLEAKPPSETPVAVEALLPPALLHKVPPQILPLLNVPVTLTSETTPPVPPPTATATPAEVLVPALSAVPPPVLSALLSVASPDELAEAAETVAKLEALPPSEIPVTVKAILPPTLVEKVPLQTLPLLNVPVTLQSVAPSPASAGPLPPPTATPAEIIVPALAAVPSPVVSALLAVATPDELAETAETVTKLEALPPSETPIPVQSILPPTLLQKVPALVLPLLNVPLTLASSAPIAPPPPATLKQIIAPVLSAVPPPVVSTLLSVATPTELAEVAETVTKLEALPPTEPPLEVATILPLSLLEKVPPLVLPLLNVPLTLPTTEVTPPVAPPATPVETIAPVLSAVPLPVVSAILSVASPAELAEVTETVTKLEALSPADAPLAAQLQVATILPPTLLAKIPPSVASLLNVPITLPPATKAPPAEAVPIVPAEVPPSATTVIIPALANVPPPVIQQILAVASPAELSDVAAIITKLEALPPADLPLATQIEVATILPPTLLAKLPPTVLPLLATPITLVPPPSAVPAVPMAPTPSVAPPVTEPAAEPLEIPGLPPSIASIAVPPLSALPSSVISQILTTASPSELAQVVDTALKLEVLTPADKEAAAALEVGSVLPPTLIQRLPPAILPLLSTPVQIPGVAPVAPIPRDEEVPITVPIPVAGPTPVAGPSAVLFVSTILPVLSPLPHYVATSIITTATPPELSVIADTITKLEAVPPPLPVIPIASILPPPLLSRLPPSLPPILAITPITLYPAAPATPSTPTPSPPVVPLDIEPVHPAEEKVLTKWAKVILQKTGNPTEATAPGELPPLQAAWMEWISLKVNASNATATTTPASPSETTTEYPWTQWLKLKSNATEAFAPPNPPLLDVTTESQEKAILEYLKALSNPPTEAPPVEPPTTRLPISPETEAMVAEALKEMGIEIVDLPPEQVQAILEQVEKAIPTTPAPHALLHPSPFLPYIPAIPAKPLGRLWPPPTSPPPSIAALIPPAPSAESPESSPPTLNLTEYLIANSLLPPETSPTDPIPLPTLTSLLASSSVPASPASSITAEELSSLTPTKFASILQQILQDCRINATTLTNSSSVATRAISANPYASYYKKKYAPFLRSKRSPNPALYPIPSQAFTPTSTPSPTASLPLPKLDTSDTILDPAYWAAQKSMFLSKLFNTLAKVALNDSTSTTPSPKEQLAKQVNTVLLSDMTRSVHHHPPKKQQPPPEYSSESEDTYDDYPADQPQASESQPPQEEDSPDFNSQEKQLVNNDDSQPKLPKEPENPLHKLFKFGVQKTVLSDLSTTPSPVFIYVTPPTSYFYPPAQVTMAAARQPIAPAYQRYSSYHAKSKSKVSKKKKQPKKPSFSSSRNHHGHHSNQKYAKPPHFRPSTSTTTENPVDFELLAKALLLDDPNATGPQTRSENETPNAGPSGPDQSTSSSSEE